jgi:hypothetical protein
VPRKYPRWLRLTLLAGALAAAAGGCVASAPTALRVALCGFDRRAAVVPSPDRRHVAAVYERNCGATTRFVTYVALTDAWWPAELWRTIVFDYEGRPADPVDVPGVRVTWLGPHSVAIETPCANAAVVAESWRSVTISATATDATHGPPCYPPRRPPLP